ncbi:hypothetical protein [Gloeothece citriformis]|uniref:hypothetical protein n=1 Tax=Gloeothece citriformis TaxID=2546356 RepID=UPI000173BD77|nr:hypothetical protein [Gloeothece citriformis]
MSQLNNDLPTNQEDINETSANPDAEILNQVLEAKRERLSQKKERQEEAYSRLADKHTKLSNQEK